MFHHSQEILVKPGEGKARPGALVTGNYGRENACADFLGQAHSGTGIGLFFRLLRAAVAPRQAPHGARRTMPCCPGAAAPLPLRILLP